jgi:hypothetical protein
MDPFFRGRWSPKSGFRSTAVEGSPNFAYPGNNFKTDGDKIVDQVVVDSTDASGYSRPRRFGIYDPSSSSNP